METIRYGEPISVIVRDNGYHGVILRYLNERLEMQRYGELWNVRVDTAIIHRSVLEGVDGVLDFTAFDLGNPVAMGAIKVELGGARLTLEPLSAPTMSINPPTRG